MRRLRARAVPLAAVTALTAAAVAGCGVSNASTSSAIPGPSGPPITVGVSLPLTGDFQSDGIASERGYQLWASDLNAQGGLLGRPVKLVVLDDKSDPNKTTSDINTLITQDHVDLTLAPFSSLLTLSAAPAAAKHGYAMVAGSAGAPNVFALKLHNFFSTTVPVETEMSAFANWVKTLPAGQRPTSAAYPMVNDPFADPPVQATQKALEAAGIKTAYSRMYGVNITKAELAAQARRVAAAQPQAVVIGSVDVPTVAVFVNALISDHWNPKYVIAASGPDQGQAFLNAVGTSNANGIMVPNGWYGNFPNALSHVMVQNYIAKYGGTASDINADVAEAYSAGEVLAAGVTGTGGTDNGAIITYLHAHTVQTVVGPCQWDANGANTLSRGSIFQWQSGAHFVQVLPLHNPGSVAITAPKPAWNG